MLQQSNPLSSLASCVRLHARINELFSVASSVTVSENNTASLDKEKRSTWLCTMERTRTRLVLGKKQRCAILKKGRHGSVSETTLKTISQLVLSPQLHPVFPICSDPSISISLVRSESSGGHSVDCNTQSGLFKNQSSCGSSVRLHRICVGLYRINTVVNAVLSPMFRIVTPQGGKSSRHHAGKSRLSRRDNTNSDDKIHPRSDNSNQNAATNDRHQQQRPP